MSKGVDGTNIDTLEEDSPQQLSEIVKKRIVNGEVLLEYKKNQ